MDDKEIYTQLRIISKIVAELILHYENKIVKAPDIDNLKKCQEFCERINNGQGNHISPI